MHTPVHNVHNMQIPPDTERASVLTIASTQEKLLPLSKKETSEEFGDRRNGTGHHTCRSVLFDSELSLRSLTFVVLFTGSVLFLIRKSNYDRFTHLAAKNFCWNVKLNAYKIILCQSIRVVSVSE